MSLIDNNTYDLSDKLYWSSFGEAFPEAPEDGKKYVRKDAIWEELVVSSVPTIVVSEFPAEPDSNTLYIKIV